jgi:hypothetical protein
MDTTGDFIAEINNYIIVVEIKITIINNIKY